MCRWSIHNWAIICILRISYHVILIIERKRAFDWSPFTARDSASKLDRKYKIVLRYIFLTIFPYIWLIVKNTRYQKWPYDPPRSQHFLSSHVKTGETMMPWACCDVSGLPFPERSTSWKGWCEWVWFLISRLKMSSIFVCTQLQPSYYLPPVPFT